MLRGNVHHSLGLWWLFKDQPPRLQVAEMEKMSSVHVGVVFTCASWSVSVLSLEMRTMSVAVTGPHISTDLHAQIRMLSCLLVFRTT